MDCRCNLSRPVAPVHAAANRCSLHHFLGNLRVMLSGLAGGFVVMHGLPAPGRPAWATTCTPPPSLPAYFVHFPRRSLGFDPRAPQSSSPPPLLSPRSTHWSLFVVGPAPPAAASWKVTRRPARARLRALVTACLSSVRRPSGQFRWPPACVPRLGTRKGFLGVRAILAGMLGS